MKLRVKSSSRSEPHGMGNNWGEENTIEYYCPCGKGTVVYEYESMVGHQQRSTVIVCPECSKKYRIENPTSRDWSIVRINE